MNVRSLMAVTAATATGLLLASAFPPLEWKEAAWIALVPLVLVLSRVSPRTAFRLGYLAGALFWLCGLYWLTRVTWPGWILLSMYCALFMAGFAYAAAWLMREWGTERVRATFGLMIVLPLVWAGFEFLRCVLFTGFAWNPLGVSQYQQIYIIQLSTWTGVYGVSALVVIINLAVSFRTDDRFPGARGGHPRRSHGRTRGDP
jgi:apolipoprotein N-acyltransferase